MTPDAPPAAGVMVGDEDDPVEGGDGSGRSDRLRTALFAMPLVMAFAALGVAMALDRYRPGFLSHGRLVVLTVFNGVLAAAACGAAGLLSSGSRLERIDRTLTGIVVGGFLYLFTAGAISIAVSVVH